jgi:hypothetical protein
MRKVKMLEKSHNIHIDERFHQLNVGNIGHVIYWWEFFKAIKDVEGCIVECGIGRGRSLLIISAINYMLEESEGGQRKIFGYDSFEGFPEPTEEDKSTRNSKKGDWSSSPSGKYNYTQDFTNMVLSEGNVPLDEISLTLVKGFFNETLPYHTETPIAFLHVDGDLYSSYIDTLENLYPKVVKGGIVSFDDIQTEAIENEKFPGARRAIIDFFGKDIFSKLKTSIGGNPYLIKE